MDERSDVLAAIARRPIEALGQRGWVGDAELTVELEHYVDRTASDLTTLPVALDERLRPGIGSMARCWLADHGYRSSHRLRRTDPASRRRSSGLHRFSWSLNHCHAACSLGV